MASNPAGSEPSSRSEMQFAAMHNSNLDIGTQQRYVHNASSRFLKIPRELRDTIYKMATTSNVPGDSLALGCVIVDDAWDPELPGILTACRQLRQESLPEYLLSNSFHLHVDRPQTIMRFEALCASLGIASKMDVEQICVVEMPWKDLIDWCKYVHSISVFKVPAQYTVGFKTHATAMSIVEECRDLPWSKVEKILFLALEWTEQGSIEEGEASRSGTVPVPFDDADDAEEYDEEEEGEEDDGEDEEKEDGLEDDGAGGAADPTALD